MVLLDKRDEAWPVFWTIAVVVKRHCHRVVYGFRSFLYRFDLLSSSMLHLKTAGLLGGMTLNICPVMDACADGLLQQRERRQLPVGVAGDTTSDCCERKRLCA